MSSQSLLINLMQPFLIKVLISIKKIIMTPILYGSVNTIYLKTCLKFQRLLCQSNTIKKKPSPSSTNVHYKWHLFLR